MSVKKQPICFGKGAEPRAVPVAHMKIRHLTALLIALALLAASSAALADGKTGHGHSYRTFTPNGDGTHTAVCSVNGCEQKYKIACTWVQLEAGDEVIELCPICGDIRSGNARLLDTEATLSALNPKGWIGHPQIFVGETDSYVFVCACYEKGGRPAPSNNLRIAATIPAETLAGVALEGLGGVSDRGLSCDWQGDHAVLGMKLVFRQPALLLFAKK